MDKPRRFRLTLGGLLVLVALIAIGLAFLRPAVTEIVDVKVGTGAPVKPGDTVVVHYVGKLGDGKIFDSSKSRAIPFELTVGKGMVIKGWEVGLIGMRGGGVRRLSIPPEQGYGERGVPHVIPPNATLYFEIELLKVR